MVDVNRPTTNGGKFSYQLIDFSQGNIISFFFSIGRKYICLYETKQKLAN